jgi:CubicO group peptidase (beta-lactamase class C family)
VKSQKHIQIETALKESCRNFVFSGYQFVTESPNGILNWQGGKTSYWPNGQIVTEDTYFDLGSLTKVILTTSVLARLVDAGKIDLNSSLGSFLSEFKGTQYQSITLKDLLTHSSGLVAWYPFYQEKPLSLIESFLKNEKIFLLADAPKKAVYSDLGFLLLGEVLKQKFGDLQKLFEKEVVEPLELKNISFSPLTANQCAATEYCLERKRLLQGEVFDLNTSYLGPLCSHAGLFSSGKNLLPWAREWLKAVHGNSSWISHKTAKEFLKRGQGLSESTWGLGWDTKSKIFSSAGNNFSDTSFGHLGFPGTSVWIDPEKSGVAILLTNRVHPSRLDERIKRFRPIIHDLVAKNWENNGTE